MSLSTSGVQSNERGSRTEAYRNGKNLQRKQEEQQERHKINQKSVVSR